MHEWNVKRLIRVTLLIFGIVVVHNYSVSHKIPKPKSSVSCDKNNKLHTKDCAIKDSDDDYQDSDQSLENMQKEDYLDDHQDNY